jgi:hypothetical protein
MFEGFYSKYEALNSRIPLTNTLPGNIDLPGTVRLAYRGSFSLPFRSNRPFFVPLYSILKFSIIPSLRTVKTTEEFATGVRFGSSTNPDNTETLYKTKASKTAMAGRDIREYLSGLRR